MELPPDVRERFRKFGRAGGRKRASRMSPEARRAVARRAGTARWIRERFGSPSFEALGLPGGQMVDAGISDLAEGKETVESLVVSIAAPRLRREGVPVPHPRDDPEDRLYARLSQDAGDLAHTRYIALLGEASSFANACRLFRLGRGRRAS